MTETVWPCERIRNLHDAVKKEVIVKMCYFSVSNFTVKRSDELFGMFGKTAIAKFFVAFLVLPFLGSFCALWVAVSGLMFAGLAGGVRLSGSFLRSREMRLDTHSKKIYHFDRVFRAPARVRTCARSHRSASRTSFSTAKTGSDDGESDQGDSSEPPSPETLPAISQTQKIQSLKLKQFLPSWHSPDCWRTSTSHLTCRKLAVKGATS